MDRTLRGFCKAQEGVEQAALSGSAGAHHRQGIADLQLETHGPEGPRPVPGQAQAVDGEQGHVSRCDRSPCRGAAPRG